MFCPACGDTNPDDARFCGKCGAALAPRREESKPPVDHVQAQAPGVDSGLKVGVVLGIVFLPILGALAGCVLGIVFMNDSNPAKRAVGKLWLKVSVAMLIAWCLVGACVDDSTSGMNW